MIRHIVLFNYSENAEKEKLEELHARFAALKGMIPEILGFEWGVNISPENLNLGFTDGYVLSFAGTKERDSYLVHPDHKAFSAYAGPLLEGVLVFDYEAEEIC